MVQVFREIEGQVIKGFRLESPKAPRREESLANAAILGVRLDSPLLPHGFLLSPNAACQLAAEDDDEGSGTTDLGY